MSPRHAITSPDAPPAIGPYAPGIRAGQFVFLSGQIPLVGATGKFAEGGVREQTEQVIANIKALLAAEDLGLGHVVKSTVFLADMNDFAAMNEIYSKHFASNPPARSTIQVARLPKDALVEIEVLAVG